MTLTIPKSGPVTWPTLILLRVILQMGMLLMRLPRTRRGSYLLWLCHIELRWSISNCTLGLQQVHTCCPVSSTRVCICCHAQTTSSLERSSAVVLCLVLLLQILVRLSGFCASRNKWRVFMLSAWVYRVIFNNLMNLVFLDVSLQALVPYRLPNTMKLCLWRVRHPEVHDTSLCFQDAYRANSNNLVNLTFCALIYVVWCPVAYLKRWNYVHDECIVQKYMTCLCIFGMGLSSCFQQFAESDIFRRESTGFGALQVA